MSDKIKQLRERIDALDLEILKLVNERAGAAHAIEDHRGDPRGLDPLGDELSDLRRRVDSCRRAAALRRLHRGRARNRAARDVVDGLHVDVLVRTEDRQARTRCGSENLFPDPAVTPDAVFLLGEAHSRDPDFLE